MLLGACRTNHREKTNRTLTHLTHTPVAMNMLNRPGPSSSTASSITNEDQDPEKEVFEIIPSKIVSNVPAVSSPTASLSRKRGTQKVLGSKAEATSNTCARSCPKEGRRRFLNMGVVATAFVAAVMIGGFAVFWLARYVHESRQMTRVLVHKARSELKRDMVSFRSEVERMFDYLQIADSVAAMKAKAESDAAATETTTSLVSQLRSELKGDMESFRSEVERMVDCLHMAISVATTKPKAESAAAATEVTMALTSQLQSELKGVTKSFRSESERKIHAFQTPDKASARETEAKTDITTGATTTEKTTTGHEPHETNLIENLVMDAGILHDVELGQGFYCTSIGCKKLGFYLPDVGNCLHQSMIGWKLRLTDTASSREWIQNTILRYQTIVVANRTRLETAGFIVCLLLFSYLCGCIWCRAIKQNRDRDTTDEDKYSWNLVKDTRTIDDDQVNEASNASDNIRENPTEECADDSIRDSLSASAAGLFTPDTHCAKKAEATPSNFFTQEIENVDVVMERFFDNAMVAALTSPITPTFSIGTADNLSSSGGRHIHAGTTGGGKMTRKKIHRNADATNRTSTITTDNRCSIDDTIRIFTAPQLLSRRRNKTTLSKNALKRRARARAKEYGARDKQRLKDAATESIP